MAKIYNSEDITLKVDTLAKKTHYFYHEDKEKPVGELSISRNDELIKLTSYDKENKNIFISQSHASNLELPYRGQKREDLSPINVVI